MQLCLHGPALRCCWGIRDELDGVLPLCEGGGSLNGLEGEDLDRLRPHPYPLGQLYKRRALYFLSALLNARLCSRSLLCITSINFYDGV